MGLLLKYLTTCATVISGALGKSPSYHIKCTIAAPGYFQILRLPVKAALAVGKNHKAQLMMMMMPRLPLTQLPLAPPPVVVNQKIAVAI